MRAISCLLPLEERQAPPKSLTPVSQTVRLLPPEGLASPSSRFLHQACEKCWSRVPVVPDEGTERTDRGLSSKIQNLQLKDTNWTPCSAAETLNLGKSLNLDLTFKMRTTIISENAQRKGLMYVRMCV